MSAELRIRLEQCQNELGELRETARDWMREREEFISREAHHISKIDLLEAAHSSVEEMRAEANNASQKAKIVLSEANQKAKQLIAKAKSQASEESKEQRLKEKNNARNVISRAQEKADQILQNAKALAETLLGEARAEGEAAKVRILEDADSASSDLIALAREKEQDILERARQFEQSAMVLKNAAKTEAKEITGAAQEKARQAIATAHSEIEADRQKFQSDAKKLSLEAVVNQLCESCERGEMPALIERPAMRRLYMSIGEILAEAQGFAVPETMAQMANQNRMDEIKAMNDALAKEIRDTEANNDWPDVVKERHIEMLLDMTDAKGGSIVKNAVDDG